MCQGPEFAKAPVEKAKATLVLQNGQRFQGYSFGAKVSIGGEVGKMENRCTQVNTAAVTIHMVLFPKSFRPEWLVIQKL